MYARRCGVHNHAAFRCVCGIGQICPRGSGALVLGPGDTGIDQTAVVVVLVVLVGVADVVMLTLPYREMLSAHDEALSQPRDRTGTARGASVRGKSLPLFAYPTSQKCR